MLKSDLQIEPYTLNEALICLNKELKFIGRNKISEVRFRVLVYNKVKIETKKVKGLPVTIEYNSIVDVFNYMTTKRYPSNRKSRKIKV